MSFDKTIAIGCDHAGVDFKNEIVRWLDAHGFIPLDCGCIDCKPVDYPDIAQAVCAAVTDKKSRLGILICGTGVGMAISANKLRGIRAANCHDYFSAKFTRLHNDANVLCLGARVIGTGLGCELVNVFLNTDFEGGRHISRLEKIKALEQKQ